MSAEPFLQSPIGDPFGWGVGGPFGPPGAGLVIFNALYVLKIYNNEWNSFKNNYINEQLFGNNS
jgi:hypothetical protein